MSNIRRAAIGAAVLLCFLPGAAFAADSILTLVLGGEAYDGPPRFEVSFDGKVIGEREVDAAIDTGTVGRFADADDKARYVQSFSFAIPATLFKPRAEVRVRLVNEAFGGEGSNRDRNLFLASVTVNGRAVTLSGLTTASAAGAEPNETLGEFLVLIDGNEEGVSAAPRGGWPSLAPATTPASIVADLAPVPGIDKVEAPVMVSMNAEVEPVEVALIDQDPEGGACQTDELFNVVGFNENSNDITPRLMKRLDQIAAAIGDQECTATFTGYSSARGSYATNALFAVERAQNALRYLKERGVKFAKVSASGVGETTQFGERLNDNRRVVISIRP